MFVTLPGSDTFFPSASFGADYKDFGSTIAVRGIKAKSPLIYVPFTAAFNFVSRDHGAVTQGGLSVNLSVPEIGSSTDELRLSRQDARGQQLSLKQTLSRTQPLMNRLIANIRLAAQLTDQPLISNEQFTVGGADSVRGYRESEALGDYGVSGGIDLRYAPLADGAELWEGFAPIDNLRLFAFVDGARVISRSVSSGPRQYKLASSGVGLSFGLFSTLEATLDLAVPLIDGPASKAGDERFLFRVSSSF